jgi:hypothetical protein
MTLYRNKIESPKKPIKIQNKSMKAPQKWFKGPVLNNITAGNVVLSSKFIQTNKLIK